MYTTSLLHVGTTSVGCVPAGTRGDREEGPLAGTLRSAVHSPRILFPVSATPFALAGLLSPVTVLAPTAGTAAGAAAALDGGQAGDEKGAATSGTSALVDTSPALGLSPHCLFPEWFVCELAHVDHCILLPPLSWSHTATAWPPVTVNRGWSQFIVSH